MSIIWNDSELTLLEALRPVFSTREINKVFQLMDYHRSMEAISKKSCKLDVRFKDFGAPKLHGLTKAEKKAIKQVLLEREELLTAIELPTLLTPAQKGQQTVERKTATAQILHDLRQVRKEVPRTSSLSTKRASGKKETLCLILSDSHIGRKVLGENGNEVYNMEIALKRLRDTPAMILSSLTADQKKNIDEVVIMMIGDHVDGEGIFPHQEMILETHAAQQVNMIIKALWSLVKTLKKHFPMVRIVTTKGNHGRTQTSPEANWDNMIFQQLELLVDLEANPNLTIKNRYGNFNTIDIKGWKGLLRHKAPVQADTAGGANKFASWYGIHKWDFFCYGHFHHWGAMTWNGKPIFRNGSLMGGDDYAESLALYDDPVQLIFGISEENLPTFIHPLQYK